MIGARTLSALAAAVVACAWAAARGVFESGYLESLAPSAALIVGIFAALAASVVFAMWHPSGVSVFAIGLHRGRPTAGAVAALGLRAIDLPKEIQQLAYLVAFAAIGLGSFDNHAAGAISNAWRSVGERGPEFCEESEESEEPTLAPVADRRGCALVRRAFEIGYENELGSCAPTTEVAADASGEQLTSVCDGRQPDEPLFHYLYRLLDRRATFARGVASDFSVGESVDRISTKVDYLSELSSVPLQAVAGAPHSSHHVWTNLAAPRKRSAMRALFLRERCANRALREPPSLDWSSHHQPASALLESALAQMLLSTRYGDPLVPCSELVVHWNAPPDTCERLAENPEQILARFDSLEVVRAVAERHRSIEGRRDLAARLGEEPTASAPPTLPGAIGLSCLMVGEPSSTRVKVDLENTEIEIRSLSVASIEANGAAQLDIYQLISELLVGARYQGDVDDAAAVALRSGPLDPSALDGQDFALTRLETLADADPFLGDRWPLDRSDLAQVYPFESHLRRLTKSFRRRFRSIRGRM